MAQEDQIEAIKPLTQLLYLFYAFAYPTLGVSALIAIMVNYWKLETVKNTWLEGHFSCQISLFWHGLLWGLIGWLTLVLYAGYIVLAVSFIWMLYRVVTGWKLLQINQAMTD